ADDGTASDPGALPRKFERHRWLLPEGRPRRGNHGACRLLCPGPAGRDDLAMICLGKSILPKTLLCCQHKLGQNNRCGAVELARPAGRYLEMASDLRVRILGGEWKPGSNLPRMQDLADEFGANRDTVARAVAILEAEGLVWAVPRRGTIVRHGMSRPRRP